jgi:hypothetical protein
MNCKLNGAINVFNCMYFVNEKLLHFFWCVLCIVCAAHLESVALSYSLFSFSVNVALSSCTIQPITLYILSVHKD